MPDKPCVEVYGQNVDASPVCYLFYRVFDEISNKRTTKESSDSGFYLIDDSVIFYSPWQRILLNLSDDSSACRKSMKKIQKCLDFMFENFTCFSQNKIPLAKERYRDHPKEFHQTYKNPKFVKDFASTIIKTWGLINFLERVGKICQTPKERFELLSSIESEYLPFKKIPAREIFKNS
jgi:hypothetical protein